MWNLMDINADLLQWSINLLIKNFCGTFFNKKSETLAMWNKFAGSAIKNENISNKELAKQLHKTIIRKF